MKRIGAWAVVMAVCTSAVVRAAGEQWIEKHPAGAVLKRVLEGGTAEGFKASGLTRKDYLALMAGNVDFWKQHQNEPGAIIDPYDKKERQYSTPAFALAAALLVQEAGRNDLLPAAQKALSFSISALENRTTADNHADFYIPMVMHAKRILASRVTKDVDAQWTKQLTGLIPEKTYRDIKAGANWNIVNVCGECLRAKDGLVAEDQRQAQAAYVERCLKTQQNRFTKFGMYEDPNAPMAYDAFPRLWLEDMMADGAYQGEQKAKVEEFLARGGLSTLLILSPSGEWACGGRSAQHQWNEAEVAVISEISAGKWKAVGRADVAGMFKRSAHLALTSMKRWQRPSGEMWIVKNRADPQLRFGYEGYSFHSQYNLLPMAMLAIAYERADEAIAERPIPSESAAYVFDLRDTFHKVVAAAGGTYVLIDTSADPHYNGTGIQRVHKAGIALSPLSDSTAGQRGYGPSGDKTKIAMTPGMQWQEGGEWRGLTDFGFPRRGEKDVVRSVELSVQESKPGPVHFTLRYALEGKGARAVEESYVVDSSGVQVTQRVLGPAPAAGRVLFPALVSDGASDTQVKIDGSRAQVSYAGAVVTYEVISPPGVRLALAGPRVPCHNGYMQAVVGNLPQGTGEVCYRIGLNTAAPAAPTGRQ